jgi:hypothetical protein
VSSTALAAKETGKVISEVWHSDTSNINMVAVYAHAVCKVQLFAVILTVV